MREYAAIASPDERYAALVIATSCARPGYILQAVAAQLRRLGARGEVVFDLLASNGTRSRRFWRIAFDGIDFPVHRFAQLEPGERVRQAATQFFIQHRAQVDLSLVPPALRAQLLAGSPLP